MKHHQLNFSGFAKQIGVQRSLVSHIFSGRNKPSLDFVIKIVEAFDDVEMDWLIRGKEHYPPLKKTLHPPVEEKFTSSSPTQREIDFSENLEKKKVEKIVIFYSDKTFDIYN